MHVDPFSWRLPENYADHYGDADLGEEMAAADMDMRFAVETGRLPVADD